jgi:hypothetical protein
MHGQLKPFRARFKCSTATLEDQNLVSASAGLHRAADSGLIPPRMTYWIRMMVNGWRRLFKPRRATADRSALVGMYLSNANRPSESSARGSETRERQEGKFSQKRRRG